MAAWRERNRDMVEEDDQQGQDIEYVVTGSGRHFVVDDEEAFGICAHPHCLHPIPVGSRAKYCCGACKQDAYRLRRAGIGQEPAEANVAPLEGRP